MADAQEILEALKDFQKTCNENKRLRRMQRDWTRVLHYTATDSGDGFTMVVKAGESVAVSAGREGAPDVVVEADSETLCDMFWGDINPTQKYMRGEIKVKATQEDVMRIDAITAVIWPDV